MLNQETMLKQMCVTESQKPFHSLGSDVFETEDWIHLCTPCTSTRDRLESTQEPLSQARNPSHQHQSKVTRSAIRMSCTSSPHQSQECATQQKYAIFFKMITSNHSLLLKIILMQILENLFTMFKIYWITVHFKIKSNPPTTTTSSFFKHA